MAEITWDLEDRFYNAGVDHGVLYFTDGSAVPWNGLVSVDTDAPIELEPAYFGGVKVYDIANRKNLSGTITAFTYPEILEEIGEIIPGAYIGGELPAFSGFSYRENINDDHYKIHVIGNPKLTLGDVSRVTHNEDKEAEEFEWNITAPKVLVDGLPPTSHLVIDTRNVQTDALLETIEELLYGNESTDAGFSSFEYLLTLLANWAILTITDHGDGTWSAFTVFTGYITDLGGYEFEIDTPSATYLDADTYEIETLEG